MTDIKRPSKTRRRGNRERTIYKRANGRWEAKIALEDGQRKSFYDETCVEVARRMAEAQHAVEQGLPLLDERQSVGTYLETWIETVRGQIRPSSWQRYSDYVRVHRVPGLGKIPLARLTAQQVQVF